MWKGYHVGERVISRYWARQNRGEYMEGVVERITPGVIYVRLDNGHRHDYGDPDSISRAAETFD